MHTMHPIPTRPFDTCPDRRGTGAEKWDLWQNRRTNDGREILPVWVADMDFQSPPCVLEALRARVTHGVFGYTQDPPGFAPAVTEHLHLRHGFTIDPAWVVGTPGIVTGLALSARLLSAADDEILTFTPIYPPFLSLPRAAGRKTVGVPLVAAGDRWAIDFDALSAAITPRSKLFWLCHPQNPTGLVFGREDLLRLADLCEAHGITVVSDEIWCDLVLDPTRTHLPFASLDHPASRRAITLVAPSKTWNIAGLGCAAAVLREPAHRRDWRRAGGGLVPMVNPLGYAAAEAAWREGEAWRQALVVVLREHRDLVMSTVAAIPGLRCLPAEATYLAWIDCREWAASHPQPDGSPGEPLAACLDAGLGPSDGRDFGAPGFIRLNFGCPTDRLREALSRLSRAFGVGMK